MRERRRGRGRITIDRGDLIWKAQMPTRSCTYAVRSGGHNRER